MLQYDSGTNSSGYSELKIPFTSYKTLQFCGMY